MDAGAILTDAVGAEIAADELANSACCHHCHRATRADALALAVGSCIFGAQPQIMAAVTGTNGKTSVRTFVRQIWNLSGVWRQ